MALKMPASAAIHFARKETTRACGDRAGLMVEGDLRRSLAMSSDKRNVVYLRGTPASDLSRAPVRKGELMRFARS
jgi:hypothetical protein